MNHKLLAGFNIQQPSYGIAASDPAGVLLTRVITNAITIIFILGAVLLIFYLLWAGIDWLMSGGDKEKVGNARKKITSALVGLVILALTFVIASFFGKIVGFNPLQQFNLPVLGDPVTTAPAPAAPGTQGTTQPPAVTPP